MSTKSYWELLRDGRWQRRRLEIMQRDGFTCTTCSKRGDDGVTLNVHHRIYHKGRKPWEYEDAALTTLCEPCHEAETGTRRRLSIMLAHLAGEDIDSIVGFAISMVVRRSVDTDRLDACPDVDPRNAGELLGLSCGFGFSLLDPEWRRLVGESGWDARGLYSLLEARAVRLRSEEQA